MRVVIIGGGITGRFLAYYLRKAMHEVTLVEKDVSGSPTSIYNAGLITPSFSPAPPIGLTKVASTVAGARGPLYISLFEVFRNSGWFLRAAREGISAHQKEVMQLGFKSLELYNTFFDEEKPQVDLQRGLIAVYKDGDYAKQTAKELGRSFVDEKELNEMGYRGLGGGVNADDEISIDPSKLYEALQKRIDALGTRVILGRRAAVKKERENGIVLLENGERLESDACVVASGAMTRELLSPLGFNPQVLPARGLSIIYRTDGSQIVPKPTLFEDDGIGLIQHNSTTIRLTSFFEMVGLKTEFAKSRIDWLVRTATTYLPGLAGLEVLDQGVGFRPCTPDQIPLIGRVPAFNNLFVATGNCRLGLTLAPVTAHIVTSLVDGKEPSDVPWKLFDPARFV